MVISRYVIPGFWGVTALILRCRPVDPILSLLLMIISLSPPITIVTSGSHIINQDIR